MNQHDDRTAKVQAKLLKLRQTYLSGMPARLQRIGLLWEQYEDLHEKVSFSAVLTDVHKLAGTATMYGFEHLGSLAFSAEEALIMHEQGSHGEAAVRGAISSLVGWQAEGE